MTDLSISGATSNGDILEYIKKMDTKFDKRFDELKDIKTKQVEHESRLLIVEKDNRNLRNEVKNLSVAMNQMQQGLLSQNVTFRGIPQIEKSNTELETIIKTIISVVTDAQEYDLELVTRLGTDTEDCKIRPVLVKFTTTEGKDSFLELKRKRNISCCDIIFKGKAIGTGTIYVNEHLGPINSKIYYHARSLKKKGIVQYVWIRQGIVFVREDESKKLVRICHIDQLKQFEGKQNTMSQQSTPSAQEPAATEAKQKPKTTGTINRPLRSVAGAATVRSK